VNVFIAMTPTGHCRRTPQTAAARTL